MTVDRWQQTDLHVPSATAQAVDRVGAGLLAADRVDCHVGAAARQGSHLRVEVATIRDQHVFGAEIRCKS